MDVLEDLFYGNIRPCEEPTVGEPYRRASRRVDELEAALRGQPDMAQGALLRPGGPAGRAAGPGDGAGLRA